ncbi:MAG: hypothetical protein IPF98_08400 [Gemmatimonadetes bacterium]|nr:hypothetical protein [Gemmatimonadota bacterium]
MPMVTFDALPDDARVWVFGSRDPLGDELAASLLRHVDAYLDVWAAHGEPLTSARTWRDRHFLVIGLDQSTAGASGCSIDALFRILHGLEQPLGTSLVTGGLVFYRDARGTVQCVDRATFSARARAGEIDGDTPVFDTTLTTLGELREQFERPANRSWHAQLV